MLLELLSSQVDDYLDCLLRAQQRELGDYVNSLVLSVRGQPAEVRKAGLIVALALLAKIQPSLPVRTWLADLPPERERETKIELLALRGPSEVLLTNYEFPLSQFYADAAELSFLVHG